MIITNRRFLFIGENISAISFDLSKLVSLSTIEMEENQNSMMFQITNRQKPIIVMLQDVAFQPGGSPWPLIHPQLGIQIDDISNRIKNIAGNTE